MKGTTYRIKKGLDLRLKGTAEEVLVSHSIDGVYAITPDDFHGIVPRVLVKEGDHVQAGSPLFTDKATERINVVSPVSGTVKAIVRGQRRKVMHISIEADATQEYKPFKTLKLQEAQANDVVEALAEFGLFAFIKQRPYDVIASPTDNPKGIFISTFSKMPLAADFSFVVKGREADFKTGIKALSRIAKVYIGISPEQEDADFLPTSEEAVVNVFDGPNPSGNVGVQINHIAPINKGEVAWVIDTEAVCMIGRFFSIGEVHLVRRIAVAGSCVGKPKYVETAIGCLLEKLVSDLEISERHARFINGNPLVGAKASPSDYLAAFATEVCIIPEGDDRHEVLGWIAPRLNDFSTSHSYFSWLFGKGKEYDLDCRIKGGHRHIIMSAEYERVFPMDIYPSYLIKAIVTGDIDKQEALGIYEVAPEDFAVAEFIDSSKLELQRIVREGLDLLRKENA